MKIKSEAIKDIRRQESFFRFLFDYIYYTFCLSFLNNFFYKKCTFPFMVIEADEIKLFDKKIFVSLFDNGIHFHTVWIPYEKIVYFGHNLDYSYFLLSGYTFDTFLRPKENSEIKVIVPDLNDSFIKCIKKNMFYHIKYNTF